MNHSLYILQTSISKFCPVRYRPLGSWRSPDPEEGHRIYVSLFPRDYRPRFELLLVELQVRIPDSSAASGSNTAFRPRNGHPASCNSRPSIGVGPDTGRPFTNVGRGNGRRLFIGAT